MVGVWTVIVTIFVVWVMGVFGIGREAVGCSLRITVLTYKMKCVMDKTRDYTITSIFL